MASSVVSKSSLGSYIDDTTTSGRSGPSYTSYEGSSGSPIFTVRSNDFDKAGRIEGRHELSSRHSSVSSKSGTQAEFERYERELPTPLRNEIEKMRRQREALVEQRLLSNMREKKRKKQENEQTAKELERKLPMDLLAKEWFSNDQKSADVRVYLIEKLMPTLVLGLEKVLCEAEKRNLIQNEEGSESSPNYLLPRPKFNPINLLAQYLMRNNPKFSNFPEASPYARGLRSVAEDLKRQVFDMRNNRLAELRERARVQREELENSEKKKIEEETRRRNLMKKQYDMWLLDNTEKLQLALVQNGLYSYLEIAMHLSSDPDNVVKFSKDPEPTDETGIVVDKEEFVEFLNSYVKDLPSDKFHDVLRHLNQCALAFRKTFEHEVWNSMFIKLFENLDTEITGFLDRHRILHLLEKFWDQVKDSQSELRNPRKWPVIELEELDDLFPDSDDDDVNESIKVSTQEEEEDFTPTTVEEESTSEPQKEGKVEESPTDADLEKHETEVKTDEEKVEETIEDSGDSKEVKDKEKEGDAAETASDKTPPTEIVRMSPILAAAEESTEELPKEEPSEEPLVESEETKIPEPGTDVKEDQPETSDETEQQETTKSDHEEAGDAVDPSKKQSVDEVPPEGEQEETKEEEEKGEDNKEKEEQEGKEQTEPEVTEEEAKKPQTPPKEAGDIAAKLLENLGGGLTLTTPAPTDDGASSEAVKIQFSKETPQAYKASKVRKTTSYTVVQKRQPEDDDKKPTEDQEFFIPTGMEKVVPPSILTQSGLPDESTEEMSSMYFNESSTHVVQRVAAEMDEDDLFPHPVDVKTRPASASRMSVTFASEPVILPNKPAPEFFSEFSSRTQSRMTSVFDENQLNKNRFVALLESFLSEEASHHIVESLLNFIHLGYIETEEEKMERIAKAHREALSAKHREKIEHIFNKWDNDGQGYLDIESIEDILSKYKGGIEASALKHGKKAVRQSRKQRFHDSKITKREFHIYINAVVDAMAGGEEVFDGVIEFVTTTVERTHAESIRGEARRKWLGQIKTAAETSGATMAPVYRFIFQTLFRDAESHGNQKKISAYIGLLERNNLYPSRGDLLIRYAASTPDNAPYMLGKAFYEDMRGISFYCVRRGKVVHVPRVHSHGRIYFWNPQRLEEEKEASLVLLPIKDEEHRVFGVMGVDNLGDPADRSVFATHELNFYQGVGKAFSSAFHHVDLKRKLLRIIDSAMSWIHSRAPMIHSITVYFVEPDPKSLSGHVLRRMMFADNSTGVTQLFNKPARLYRKDNLFRDYLFKCMESSDTTTADAYGEYHMAYPLRGEQGHCQCLIDISLGKLRELPKHETQEMLRMLKLLQAANKEVLRESSGGKKTIILEAEQTASDDTRVEIMFDRLMLTDLRENVNKLDTNVFAELHNYNVPPAMIHNILKAVLMLFHQDEEEYAEFEDWIKCKQLATTKLRQQIVTFDPTAEGAVSEEVAEKVSLLLKGIAHGAVAKHGSMPAQQLYNWAFVCLSLIEHTKKAGDSCSQPAVTPLTSASTGTTTDTQDTGNFRT